MVPEYWQTESWGSFWDSASSSYVSGFALRKLHPRTITKDGFGGDSIGTWRPNSSDHSSRVHSRPLPAASRMPYGALTLSGVSAKLNGSLSAGRPMPTFKPLNGPSPIFAVTAGVFTYDPQALS